MAWLTWRRYLAFGAALAVAYYLAPSGVAKFVIWPMIGLSSAVVIVIGVRRYRPDVPLAWWLFVAAKLAFITGDTAYNVRVRLLHTNLAFPSVVDLFYLLVGPSLIVGLLLLIRRRSPGRDLASLLDAAIITTGASLLSWVFLISPYIRAEGLSPGQRLVAVAYPVADLLILAVAVRAGVSGGRRSPAWWLLAASVVPLLFADSLFGLLQIEGVWQVGGPVDLGWIAFYVCWGAAALHPSMAKLSEPAAVTVRLSPGRLLLLTGASLIAPAVLVVQAVRGEPLEVPVVAAGSAVLILLVLARMGSLAGELGRQHERKRIIESALRMTQAERMQLAITLHDGPVQRMTTMAERLMTAPQSLEQGGRQAAVLLAESGGAIQREADQLRGIIDAIRPPVLDKLGFEGAIRSQAADFQLLNSGVACTVDIALDGPLTPQVDTVLYEVLREALTNIAKHAGASHVQIDAATIDGVVRLRVHDDGIGFDVAGTSSFTVAGRSLQEPHGHHFGLAGMRQQVELLGGQLFVKSELGRGTTITAELDQQLAQ
jgi:signal transduction histidine kinase